MNRKIKIIDDTIVISDIFGDNIVFYVHGSLKCATLFTNFELKTTTLFEPIWAYNRTLLTNEIRHPHYEMPRWFFILVNFYSYFFCCSVNYWKKMQLLFLLLWRDKKMRWHNDVILTRLTFAYFKSTTINSKFVFYFVSAKLIFVRDTFDTFSLV